MRKNLYWDCINNSKEAIIAEALMELYETISPEAQQELFDFALFLASRQRSYAKNAEILKNTIEDLKHSKNCAEHELIET